MSQTVTNVTGQIEYQGAPRSISSVTGQIEYQGAPHSITNIVAMVEYAESTGGLIRLNMNAGMQDLVGGING